MKDFEFLNILSRHHIHVHVLSNVVVLKNDFEKRRLVLIVYK